jgi:hypothetical protein
MGRAGIEPATLGLKVASLAVRWGRLAYTGKGACPPGSYTRKTARAELDARLTEVRRGVARNERTGETFADAAAEWLRWVESRGRKPSPISGYRSMIHRHLDPAFGNLPIDKVTANRIEAYLATIADRSPRTRNKLVIMMNGISPVRAAQASTSTRQKRFTRSAAPPPTNTTARST